MLSNRLLALLTMFLLAGCPTSNSDMEAAGGAGGSPAGGGASGQAGSESVAGHPGVDAGSPLEMPKLPAPDAGTPTSGRKPIGLGCAANAECATGFCVDNVCCDSACDGQCSVCNVTGNEGYCSPQFFGDDATSAQTCTGAHTCAFTLPGLNLAACRLKDLQACHTNSDCASLLCQTFYVDHDGDGYGDSNTTISFCEVQGATPPVGYVAQGGDCCDSDANAFPGQTKYFTAADRCGSWDFNCDGTIQGSNGLSSYGTVPSTECGTTVHGSCTTCTNTISCH